MRLITRAALALLAIALHGLPANAATHRFELAIDGGPVVTFNVDNPASPSWSNEGGFELSGLSATFDDPGEAPMAAGVRLFFYIGDYGGGFDLTSSRGDEYGFFGPQIYSGTNAAPLFSPGLYTLDRGSLTISDIAPVPEPGEWAMLFAGAAIISFVARRRSTYSAATASGSIAPHRWRR